MADPFENYASNLESPLTGLVEITPNDAVDLATVSRAITVAAAGTVEVTMLDGSVGSVYIAAGIPFPIRVTRVWATGTTATGIVALS